jgi:hypothetical protein
METVPSSEQLANIYTSNDSFLLIQAYMENFFKKFTDTSLKSKNILGVTII